MCMLIDNSTHPHTCMTSNANVDKSVYAYMYILSINCYIHAFYTSLS